MKILAIEYSSEIRSVAVAQFDPAGKVQIMGAALESGGRVAHTTALMEQALREAGIEREEIQCLAVGLGPGSYTGIRSAIATVQGWQLVTGIQVKGISSIACMALDAWDSGFRGPMAFVVDAQKGEFYLSPYEFDESGCREAGPLKIVSLEEVLKVEAQGCVLSGPDQPAGSKTFLKRMPDAAFVARLAFREPRVVSGEQLEPIYLRETTFVKVAAPTIKVARG